MHLLMLLLMYLLTLVGTPIDASVGVHVDAPFRSGTRSDTPDYDICYTQLITLIITTLKT